MGNDKLEQTRCRISNEGHRWMVGWYDDLPPTVRQRLRQSPYNLCAACLRTIYVPKVRKRQRGLSYKQAFFVAIEIYEREEREALNKGK
jgi:hypothetical protein